MMETITMATTTNTTTHSPMMMVVTGIWGSVESGRGPVTAVVVGAGGTVTRADTTGHTTCNNEIEQLQLAHLDQCLH